MKEDTWTTRMIARALKQEETDQQYREFAGSFIYDVLQWTPPKTVTDADRTIIEESLDLLESIDEVREEDLRNIYNRVHDTLHWCTVPETDEVTS